MDSQEDSLNSARLREFKEYLLKFGDDFEASLPSTVADSDGDGDSNRINDVNESLHEILTVGKHAETLVHASASGQSRWNTFRQRLAKQTGNLRVPRCKKSIYHPHPSANTSQRDRRRRLRAGYKNMPGYTPPQSGDGSLQAETQPYPEWVYNQYVTKAVESSQPAKEQDRHPTGETSPQPNQMVDQNENDVQIDLVTGFQQSQTGPDGDDSDYGGSSVNRDFNALSSSPGMVDILSDTGFSQQARTPVSHWGKQIGYDGPRSEATTPALPVNPFARDGATTGTVMGLSQVFQATQATTPLRPKLVSDPLTERPSPDIYNHQRRPAPAFISSPLQHLRTSSDRPVATSPQNPQRGRENVPRKGRSSSINRRDTDEFSDDDLGPSLSQQVRERIRRRKKDEEIRKTLSEFKVILPEKENEAKKRKGRGKKGEIQRAGRGQLGKKPQEEPPLQSAKRVAQPEEVGEVETTDDEEVEEVETTDNEEEPIERAQPIRNATAHTPRAHGKKSLGAIQSDGAEVLMTTTRQMRKPGTRPSLQNSSPRLMQQEPRSDTGTTSPKPQSHLPAVTASDTPASVIVQGTPVGDIANSQQSPIKRNELGNKASLAPPSYIIRSSGEPASVHSETQSTIVQAEPNNRPNVNFTFKGVNDSTAPQAVVDSGAVVASSAAGGQQPKPQTESIEVTAPQTDIEASEDRVHNERDFINSQRDNQLRPDSSCPDRQECSAPGGHSLIPASTNQSDVRAGSVSKGRLGEGGAVSPQNQTSLNRDIVIPETSPAGGSRPLSPVIDSSAGDIYSFPVSFRDRPNSLGDTANPARAGKGVPNTTNASGTATAHADAALPEQRSDPKLGKESTTALGQSNGNHQRAVNQQFHGTSEAQDHFETASISDASEDDNVNSSPLSHVKKRRKGNDGTSVSRVPRQPHQSSTSNVPGSIGGTTARLESGDNIAGPRGTNAKTKGKPSKPLRKPKPQSEAPQIAGGSRLTSKSLGHRKGQHALSNNERSLLANGGDSPTSTRQLRHSRSQLDTSHAQDGRENEQSGSPAQETGEPRQNASNTSVTHPNRVFALFKGLKLAFYPATCLCSVGENECRVRFDDGNISILDSSLVCSLDLRQGDVVKVDLSNMRQKNYVIVGLRNGEDNLVDPESQSSGQYPRTDIHGHNIAVLRAKSGGRLSSAGSASNNDTVNVPLARLYIVKGNWLKFKDRIHTHPAIQRETETRSQTPTRAISAPLTPSSRSRRVKSATPRHGMTVSDRPISQLFRNMAFAVTYGENEVDKKLVIKHIKMNGGTVLEDGLNELFDMDSATPAPGHSHMHISGGDVHSLKLKSEWERTGFVCVLADQHCRRAKYMEALALGLPCLAGRWIEDCVRHNAIISWEPYILPSGESRYLGNAVRNRSLQYYTADTAKLAMTIESRPKLLDGKSVLIMRSGETIDSRETFFFLINALGASRIDRVANIEAANTVLMESRSNGPTWDFLYTGAQKVNPNDLRVSTVSAGMKRKRSFNARLRSTEDGLSNEPTKIIDNEFLVQSLILGRLLDE